MRTAPTATNARDLLALVGIKIEATERDLLLHVNALTRARFMLRRPRAEFARPGPRRPHRRRRTVQQPRAVSSASGSPPTAGSGSSTVTSSRTRRPTPDAGAATGPGRAVLHLP